MAQHLRFRPGHRRLNPASLTGGATNPRPLRARLPHRHSLWRSVRRWLGTLPGCLRRWRRPRGGVLGLHPRAGRRSDAQLDWEDVATLLLDRVVGVSTSPEFTSSDIENVAAALAEAAREEREATKRARKRSLGLMNQVAAQLNLQKRVTESLGGITGFSGYLEPARKESALQLVAGRCRQAALFRQSDTERLTETLGSANLTLEASSAMRGLRRQVMAADLTPLTGTGRIEFDTKGLGIGLRAALPALQDFSKVLEGCSRPLVEQLVGNGFLQGFVDASPRWIEVFKRALPINWRELDGAEVDAVVKLMLDTGISVAWAPRTSIIRELLAGGDHPRAEGDPRSQKHRDPHDIEEVLEGLHPPGTAGQRHGLQRVDRNLSRWPPRSRAGLRLDDSPTWYTTTSKRRASGGSARRSKASIR